MTNDLDSLLNALEPAAAGGDLPAGYRLGRPMDSMIGPPVVEYTTARRGNKTVKALTPESRKMLQEYRAQRWQVLDPGSPDAVAVWEQHAQAVNAEQERVRREQGGDTASKPAAERPQPIRIVRV